MIKLIPYLVLTLLGACAANTDEPGGQGAQQLEACREPRAQVCTMQYDPVCAVLPGGERKEYSNACTACSDERVETYQPGPCP